MQLNDGSAGCCLTIDQILCQFMVRRVISSLHSGLWSPVLHACRNQMLRIYEPTGASAAHDNATLLKRDGRNARSYLGSDIRFIESASGFIPFFEDFQYICQRRWSGRLSTNSFTTKRVGVGQNSFQFSDHGITDFQSCPLASATILSLFTT
jgi:hypothetical protein